MLSNVSIPKFISDANSKSNAFFGCTSLVSLNFPLYNGKIDSGMFQGCSLLTSVNLSISGPVYDSAFFGTKITSVDLTAATSIGSNVFDGVTTLTSNVVANLCTTIGDNAFRNTSITGFQSDACTYVGLRGFYNCIYIISMNFPNLLNISSSTGAGTSGTFQNCIAMTSFTAPNFTYSSSTLKASAFAECSSLTSLNFPLYNGPIEAYMFRNCSSLTSINITANGSIDESAFEGTKITSLDFTNVTSIGAYSFRNVTTLIQNIVANSCTTIGTCAFQNTRIIGITANVCSSIATTAFKDCTALVSATFNSLITLNSSSGGGTSGTFQNCTSMTTFSAPLCTTITNGWAFANCTSVTSFNLRAVTTLGSTVLDNNNFYLIKTGCSITVPIAMATINAGAPEGDLQYAISSRAAIVTYV